MTVTGPAVTVSDPTESGELGGGEVQRARRRRWWSRFRLERAAWRRMAAAALSGLMMGLAFPPFDVGPLALVALVPLLWAWRRARPARAALYGFGFGCVFFGMLLSWIWYFGALAYIPLVSALAAYVAVTGLIVSCLEQRGLRSAWFTAAAWVLLETLRGRWPLGGLPWGEAGVAVHSLGAARAVASWGGVALVSFLVVAINGFVLDVVLGLPGRRWRLMAWAASGLVLVVVLTTLGQWWRCEPTGTGRLRFALLQGNDQNRHLSYAQQTAYLPQSHLRLAATLRGRFDLIVFPESSVGDRNPEADPQFRQQLIDVGRAHLAAVLVNVAEPGPGTTVYNANLLYDPDGRLQGSYAKQHLVAFGEYVPWRHQLGFVAALNQIPRDYTPGTLRRLFRVHGHPVGTVICFESAFGPLVRDFVRDGAQVIVVSTNNASYRKSANSAQHLALSQMRAAETGRPVLHASVSGITGVIDAAGHVRRTTSLFHNAVVTGTITTTTGRTPYVRYGDWVVAASGLALIAAATLGEYRRRHSLGH